ncbi:MAG: ATP-dependent serine peptidase containing a domain protein [Microbacteriaceae bacterium]|nr:ATP-dependent serine peptidase containing a domain protein [Microbacteriaceae bacterium]HEV7955972.1 S16 family serine protease [Marisediminicola sp.]
MPIFADLPGMSRTQLRRSRLGWSLLSFGVLGALGLSLVPSPYVIEVPGPVFDTLGDVEVQDEKVPLIAISDQEEFPTDGTLSLLTVSVVGNREVQPSWLKVITAWADPSKAVVPIESVYPAGVTLEQSQERSAIDMQNSQKDAIAAALTKLGHELESTLTVAGLSPDSPSDGLLKAGDEILRVNGDTPVDVNQMRAIIAENGTDTPVAMAILRDGALSSVLVTPVSGEGPDAAPMVGVAVETAYDFPFEVEIQLEKVGGPSAGMMFALGIIDKLTPGELNGGLDVAGTGTITADGLVGPIGGIRQKLHGAQHSGAEYFLAPAANCGEVTGHVPDGLTVFAVETLDDSLAALETLASGGDTSALPSCDN